MGKKRKYMSMRSKETMTSPNMQEAKKLTAWLMNPIEIDYSDPVGEFKAREKQANDMAEVVASALDKHDKEAEARGRLAGLEEGAKVAENGTFLNSTECNTVEQMIAQAIRQRSSNEQT